MSSARYLAFGAAALVLAAFAWFIHVTSASAGRHSWESGGGPKPVDVQAGKTYHLSTRDGFSDSTAHAVGGIAVFSCTYSGVAGNDLPLSVDGGAPDARVLHRVASFVAPQSGPIAVTCADLGAVYVDDAKGAAFDRAGLFVLVTIVFGFAGAVLIVGGLMRSESLSSAPATARG